MAALDVDELRRRAADWIAWADGYEETNEQRARLLRALMRDVLELVDAYAEELRGRLVMQGNYERALAVIGAPDYVPSDRRPAEPPPNPF